MNALATGDDAAASLGVGVNQLRVLLLVTSSLLTAAVVSVAVGEASSSALGFALEAKLKGFEGDACPECGNFTMVRNGTCLKCTTCGGTTGCS